MQGCSENPGGGAWPTSQSHASSPNILPHNTPIDAASGISVSAASSPPAPTGALPDAGAQQAPPSPPSASASHAASPPETTLDTFMGALSALRCALVQPPGSDKQQAAALSSIWVSSLQEHAAPAADPGFKHLLQERCAANLRMACSASGPCSIAWSLQAHVASLGLCRCPIGAPYTLKKCVVLALMLHCELVQPLMQRPDVRRGVIQQPLRAAGLGAFSIALGPQMSQGSLPRHRLAVGAMEQATACSGLLTKQRRVLCPAKWYNNCLAAVTDARCSVLRHVCWAGDEVGLHLALGVVFLGQPLTALAWGIRGVLSHVLHLDGWNDTHDGRPWARENRPPPDSDLTPPRRRRMLQLLLGITGPAACPPSVLAQWSALAPLWRAARWGGSALRHGRGGMVRHRAATRHATK